MAEKMAKFLLQDNISPSSQQHFWGVYILLDSPFLARLPHSAAAVTSLRIACVRLTGWPPTWNWRRAILSADADLLVATVASKLPSSIRLLLSIWSILIRHACFSAMCIKCAAWRYKAFVWILSLCGQGCPHNLQFAHFCDCDSKTAIIYTAVLK